MLMKKKKFTAFTAFTALYRNGFTATFDVYLPICLSVYDLSMICTLRVVGNVCIIIVPIRRTLENHCNHGLTFKGKDARLDRVIQFYFNPSLLLSSSISIHRLVRLKGCQSDCSDVTYVTFSEVEFVFGVLFFNLRRIRI